MFKRRPISKGRKAFRRILLGLAFIAFLFAAFMSYFYVGHRNGSLKQEDVAPTVFATDVYLYKVKAYWTNSEGKLDIAKRLVQLGFFDRQYHDAGYEMMASLAENGNSEAQIVYGDYLMSQPDVSHQDKKQAIQYFESAANKGNEEAEKRLSFYAALAITNRE